VPLRRERRDILLQCITDQSSIVYSYFTVVVVLFHSAVYCKKVAVSGSANLTNSWSFARHSKVRYVTSIFQCVHIRHNLLILTIALILALALALALALINSSCNTES